MTAGCTIFEETHNNFWWDLILLDLIPDDSINSVKTIFLAFLE